MAATIRDTLFGDQPVYEWPSSDISELPWSLFLQAANALNRGDKPGAIACWKRVLVLPNLEPRHYLQAWTFLRQNGEQPPPAVAKLVYGVVVEVMMDQGLDLLAAYSDFSARYYNYSGRGVVWEHPDTRLDVYISRLLDAGKRVVDLIGPWTEARPGPPPKQQARISMLTPSGLFFGQGTLSGLSGDRNGKLLVDAATDLLMHITSLNDA